MKQFYLVYGFLFLALIARGQNNRWDNQFTSLNAPDDTVFAVAGSNGNIYAGGAFTNAGGVPANHIAVFDGSAWNPLGAGVDGKVYALKQTTLNLFAGGSFTQAGGFPAVNVAAWDGSAWLPLATSCNGTIRALEVYDQYLYAGGDFTSIDGVAANYIARFDGSIWEALGTGTDGPVYCIKHTGILHIGGNFVTADGNTVNNVARWNGSGWDAVGDGFDGPVHGISGTGTQIIAAGSFTASGLNTVENIAKWTGSEWLSLDSGTDGIIRDIEQVGGTYYVCGQFTTAGPAPAGNIASWNGTAWETLGDGINQQGFCLSSSGYDVICGGAFSVAGADQSVNIGRYFSPPVIYQQSGIVTICRNDTLLLFVNATSSLPVTFQWEKDGVPLTPDNDTLLIPVAQLNDTGEYTCSVTNSAGSATSAVILVNILQEPIFSTTLTDSAVCGGTNITFLTDYIGSNPVSFQWYYSSVPIPGETGDSISFIPANETHSGSYYCISNNICGSDTTYLNFTVHTNPIATFTGLAAEYCINDSASVLTGIPSGGVFSGNGISGNEFNPSGLVGYHNINYVYTDSNNCTGSYSQSTLIHTLTIVSFTGLDANYCYMSGDDTLHGIQAGGIYYGTGVSDSIFSPSLAGPGNHTVYYAYTDTNGCTNTQLQSTFIFSNQLFSYPGIDSVICLYEAPYDIPVLPAGGFFSGPGITGSMFDPQVTGAGAFEIFYFYTDVNNCEFTDSIILYVSEPPVVTLTGINSQYCINQTGDTLSGNPAGGVFSGTNIYNEILNPGLFQPGIYTAFYTYTDTAGCSGSDSASFEIINAATVFITGISTLYCENEQPDVLTGVPAGGLFSGNGVSGNMFSPSAAGSGTHTVVYSYDNMNGCISYDSVDVFVRPVPALSLGSDTSICLNETLTITAAGDTGNLFWSTGDTTISITVTPQSTTIYFAVLSDSICSSFDSIEVVVNPLPVFNLGNDTTACPPVLLSAPAGYSSYLWSDNSTGTSVSVVLTGNYALTVTNDFGCSSSSQVNINVLPVPMVDLGDDKTITQLQTIIIGASQGYSGYLWSTNSTQSFIVVSGQSLNPGSYSYWLSVTNTEGCSATDTILVIVVDEVGINDNSDKNISVFPNPANEYFNISIPGTGMFNISLISTSGECVLEQDFTGAVKQSALISVSGLPEGVYLMRIRTTEEVFYKKIIKK